MNPIDIENWHRREAYNLFSQMSNPFYMVTFRQDVTALYDFAKSNGLSFYYSLIWACTQSVNEVEAFHIAVRDGTLVRINRRDPSFTDLHPGADLFHIVTMEDNPDIRAFSKEAKRLSGSQDVFIHVEKETDDLIYYSCIPWVDLTALTNERDLSEPGALEDSIPRISWGKYTEENGQKILGMSIEVNHRFIDGLHIGQFADHLSRRIEKLKDLK